MTLNPNLRTTARTTGLLYIALFVFGMFGPLVLEGLLAAGDAAAVSYKVQNGWAFRGSIVAWFVIVVVDLFVSVLFYQLLRERSPTGALNVAGLRLVYTAMLAANLVHLATVNALASGPLNVSGEAAILASLTAFDHGFVVALAIFGAHLVSLAVVAVRTRIAPRWLGIALGAAGLAYIADTFGVLLDFGIPAMATNMMMTLAVIGELSLTVWLLVAGRRHAGRPAASRVVAEVSK